MRVLAITQIWPNSLEPHRTPFNLQQFKRLAQKCDLTVLAAIAHVPGSRFLPASVSSDSVRSMKLRSLPDREFVGGIDTRYMRQVYIPKVGVPVAVPLYLASLAPHRALLREADVVLGTWAYPDGCAAVLAARAYGKPCAVKVHGTDVNVIARRTDARPIMSRVLPRADALVSVSAALSVELERLGVPRSKIQLVPNGVDTGVFTPRDKRAARKALGVPESAPLVVFVGRLEQAKGIDELLEAIPRVRQRIPGAMFALLGEQVAKDKVAWAVAEAQGAIIAPGIRPLKEVADWLTACDVFTLPSWMEGTPNVVLEALASGRPVVATNVGGIPHVLPDPAAGFLVPPKDAGALADALCRALERVARGEWKPEDVRAHGPGSWEESAAKLYSVLDGIHQRWGAFASDARAE